ncbi:MAG: YkgJ family cysteine cluster protein [Desulfosoma sp.]
MNPAQDTEVVYRAESTIRFACHHDLPCFTQCCRDVNIYLTPYDILRLRRRLRMGSTEFLARYTRHYLAKVTHVPVVQLAMDPETLRCPFVGDEGCRVYEDRPWACRMFPLDLGKENGAYRLLADKKRCLGLHEGPSWTVGRWLKTQGVDLYEAMEQAFQQVMPPDFKPGERMEAGLGKLLYLAYDLDRFDAMLSDPRFRAFYGIDEDRYEKVQQDDEEKLLLAFAYIQNQMAELFSVL